MASDTVALALAAAGLWLVQAGLNARLARSGRPGGPRLWWAGLVGAGLIVGLTLFYVAAGLLKIGQPLGAGVLAGAALLSAIQFVLLFGARPTPDASGSSLITIYGAFWLGQTALFWLGLAPSWALAGAAMLPRFWNDAALFALALPVVPVVVAAGALYVRRQDARGT